ncbi:MAG: AmmeMemoRadiSam system radical SAM enzyme, partial [Bacteroidota bacterium]|nr:AmmeMemoRadiSam system radical SAM enzyme [Bacteroidota bacterium]
TELGTDIPLHLTAFHPDYRMRDHAPTPAATLRRVRARARENGLRYVYTGNIRDVEGQTTTCVECGAVLIGRDGYTLTAWELDAQGCCASCGAACPGRFDAKPGRWGARRLQITI